MQLVVDANILFSALVKDSLTRKIFFESDLQLFAPEFLLTEFAKYKSELLAKAGLCNTEFEGLMESFLGMVDIISAEEYGPLLKLAEKVCPDASDVPYFALARKLNCAIWSNDKELKKQDEIMVYSTQELIDKFLGLSG